MCNPALIAVMPQIIGAVVGVAGSAVEAVAQNNAIESANKRAAEGIERQQTFNREVAMAKAIEERDKNVVDSLNNQKDRLRARGKLRVAGLNGGNQRRLERDVEAQFDRRNQLLGFRLDSAQERARLEIRGANVSALNQYSNLPRGISAGYAIGAAVIKGAASIGGAAAQNSLSGGDLTGGDPLAGHADFLGFGEEFQFHDSYNALNYGSTA